MSIINDTVIATANSGASAGAASCSITVGSGFFEILSVSVSAGLTTDRAQAVAISIQRTLGDGSTVTSFIGRGWFDPQTPFVITNVKFKGPGTINSSVFHLDTTSHNLTIEYRRKYI